MPVYDLNARYDALPEAVVTECRKNLGGSLARIEHCLDQLSDDDVWWRPTEAMNAIGNLVLHLCGNLGQWVISAVADAPPTRNRPQEFATRERVPKEELRRRLRDVVQRCDAAMATLDEKALLTPRRIQGHDSTLITAILHAVIHFEGHAQEIIYITRLRLGDRYRFLWTPQTPEQASAR